MRHKDPDRAHVYYPLTNADKFRDQEQQEQTVLLLEDILSKFSGNWIGSSHGEEQSRVVFFTSEFQSKLRSGALLEG